MSQWPGWRIVWPKIQTDSDALVRAITTGCIAILVAVLVLAKIVISDERKQTYATIQDLNAKIALSDEVRIRSLLASLDKVLLVLRSDHTEKPLMSRADLLRRMEQLRVNSELNPRISFTDASGNVVLSSALDGNGHIAKLNVSDRAYFQTQKAEQGDKLIVAAPIEGRLTGKWAVPLTRRLSNKDGSFAGIVSMIVDPGLFTDPFEKTSLGPDATRAIMGLDGYTLLRLNGGALIYGGDTRKSQVYKEIQQSAVGCYTAVAASDGVRRSVCYRVIEPYSIIILAGSSVASIESMHTLKVRRYVWGFVLFGVLVVLLSGLLIVGVLRQKKLIFSQKSFNDLIELVPQSISRLDMQGKIIWVNRRTIEFAGPSTEEQAKGFDWVFESIHPDDQSRIKDFIGSMMPLNNSTQSCEYRKRRFDNAYFWYSCQVTRVLDSDGVGYSFLYTSTDINDRKMAEERALVTQKLESIGQLTGGMAHDFNNLLAIIIGNLDLVRPDVADGAAKRLDIAVGAAQRGVGLVKSLLAMASKQPLMPSTVDLWALVERISPLLRHALGPRINFELRPPSGIVKVEVDEAGLEAVLLNLIVNARDAMPQGGTLTLALSVANSTASLFVTDNGTGMPVAVLKRATEPFFTTKENGQGTGLGLSMVARFAKQSGGKMDIQSTVGMGTTVEMAFPLAQSSQAITVKPQTVSVQVPQGATRAKRKILIVDDEPALSELVRDWARSEGYTAVVAHSADDALSVLAVKSFDVMLTDIMMPGSLDGLGLAHKAHVMRPDMEILVMSGYSKETAANRGEIIWQLLVKPFAKNDFIAALEKTAAPRIQNSRVQQSTLL